MFLITSHLSYSNQKKEKGKKHQRISIMHKLLTKAVYEYYVYVAKEHQCIEKKGGGGEGKHHHRFCREIMSPRSSFSLVNREKKVSLKYMPR